MKYNTQFAFGLLGATLLAVVTSACAPITRTPAEQVCDPLAAKKMALKDHCLACHSMTRQKGGPSFNAIAAKYHGNPNAEAELYEHLTTGDVSRMSDGNTQYHKCIANENPEKIRNMVRWILVQ